jgi:hypothetical protein
MEEFVLLHVMMRKTILGKVLMLVCKTRIVSRAFIFLRDWETWENKLPIWL